LTILSAGIGSHRPRRGYGQFDNIEEPTVPPDSFYVLGDDRDDSLDSR
jgi:hypothetical protein